MTETEAEFECVVRADLFRRALHCVSDEETRYYLSGVFVSPSEAGGAFLVATDGRIMVVLRDEDAHVRGSGIVHLHKSMITALTTRNFPPYWPSMPRLGKALPHRQLAVKGGVAAVVQMRAATAPEDLLPMTEKPNNFVLAYQWTDVVIKASYPDWRAVVPKWPEAPPTGGAPPILDGELVQKITKALHATPQATAAWFIQSIENGPLIVLPSEALDGGNGFGILMPRRSHGGVTPKPDAWIANLMGRAK